MASRRRPFEWARRKESPTQLASNVVAAESLVVDLEAELGASLRDYTVTRLIGRVTVAQQTHSTTGQGLYVGVIVAPRNTPAAFEPERDPEADWMYYNYVVPPGWAHESATSSFAPASISVDFDIRSQRKVPGLERFLVIVVEAAGTPLIYSWYCGALLKMP